jgi:hypothetical protein
LHGARFQGFFEGGSLEKDEEAEALFQPQISMR